MTYSVCNAVTHAVSNVERRSVQIQNQIQTVVRGVLVVVSGLNQIQSDRHLGIDSAPIGFGDLR